MSERHKQPWRGERGKNVVLMMREISLEAISITPASNESISNYYF